MSWGTHAFGACIKPCLWCDLEAAYPQNIDGYPDGPFNVINRAYLRRGRFRVRVPWRFALWLKNKVR